MNVKPYLKLFVPLLSVGAMIAVTTGCSHTAVQQAPPPATVTIAPVEQKDIVEWEEFTGRIEPVDSVEIRPRVSGYIQQVKFQSGQLVKKGDVLFVIDPRWAKATFDQRQAEYEHAKAVSENMSREAERTPQLLANKAISTEENDSRQSHFQESKAMLLAAQAAVDTARLDLDYTEVRAPIDGRVSRALLTEGNYASGVPGAATMLTTVVSVDPVYAYADIDENSLLKFNALVVAKKLEMDADGKIPVDLQLADEEGYPHRGHIESFDNRVDPNTGSILLRAVFANPDGRVLPGLFARIRLPLSERHPVILVDERAVGTDQAQKFVLSVTSSNTVQYRPVQLGAPVDGKRIVSTGLQAGDKIIVNGMARVRPGMPVKAEELAAAPASEPVETAKR